jgi:hypothetical protein
VLELDDSLDEYYRPFQGYEKVYQGSLADCEAFIRLKEKGYSIEVSERADAVGNYDKTQIVDLTGTATETAKKMAIDLGGEIVQLPSTEKKPQGEILIIGGSNL